MYATPHRNVFGITTHYGTHPDPPHQTPFKRAASAAATGALAFGFTVVGVVKAAVKTK